MHFRIGVDFGEVQVEGDNVFGDCIGVAEGLQQLAEPGGVCISHAVFERTTSEVQPEAEDLGPQRIENIVEPIRAYRIRTCPKDIRDAHRALLPRSGNRLRFAVAGLVLALVAAILANQSGCRPEAAWRDGSGAASSGGASNLVSDPGGDPALDYPSGEFPNTDMPWIDQARDDPQVAQDRFSRPGPQRS